jgi:hypothetical protein
VYSLEGGFFWDGSMDEQSNRPHRKTKEKKSKAHGGKLQVSVREKQR